MLYLENMQSAEEAREMRGKISYDYQLTYLYKTKREVIGELMGNEVRISLPSLIDNFSRNLVDDVITTLNIVLLHELSHWANQKDYGNDLEHSPKWNSLLSDISFPQ